MARLSRTDDGTTRMMDSGRLMLTVGAARRELDAAAATASAEQPTPAPTRCDLRLPSAERPSARRRTLPRWGIFDDDRGRRAGAGAGALTAPVLPETAAVYWLPADRRRAAAPARARLSGRLRRRPHDPRSSPPRCS